MISIKFYIHLEFDQLNDFSNWYSSLTPKEIMDGQKEWCSGDCCQSLLMKLLEFTKT